MPVHFKPKFKIINLTNNAYWFGNFPKNELTKQDLECYLIWPDGALNRGISFVHILRLFLFWFQLHFSATVRNIYRRPTPAVFTRPANRATTLCHRGLGFKAIFPCKRWFAVRSAPGRAADWDARSYRQPKLMLIWKPTLSETSAIFVTLPSTMF